MADQTILQETLDNNIVDGDWLIYWKTSTGVQRRVARSSLLGATLTGAGTIATGGFTLTVPATGTAALKIGTPVANNVAQWDNANAVEDAGFAASNVALLDGSRSLTADWDIGDNRRVKADGVRARDGAGLRLEDDAGNLGVFVEDGGDVGIGTATPSVKLDVAGAITASGVITGDGSGLTTLNASNISSGTLADARFPNALLRDGSRTLTADWDIGDNRRVLADGVRARDGAGLRLEDDAGNLGVFVEDGGDVGIGTATPSVKLDVAGAITASGVITGDGSGLTTLNASNISSGTLADARFPNALLRDGSRTLTADWDIGDNRRVLADGVRARDGAGLRLEDDAGNLGVFVEDGGQVGIGTTTPTAQLDVSSGPINVAVNHGNLLSINNTVWTQPLVMRSQYDVTNGDSVDLLVPSAAANTANLRLTSAGNVGIGITSPAGKLVIGATGGVASPGSIALSIRDGSSPTFGFDFNLEGALTGDMSIMKTISGVQSQVMTFQRATGNVGIGTTTPGAKLEVDQASATANIPTLHLRQADDSEEFIRFEATVGAGNAIDTAALGTYYGKIRVHVDGVGDKFIALYDS